MVAMAYNVVKQFGFGTGEISPRIFSNSNAQEYQTALSSSNNVLIGLTGFATWRPGTKYVANAKDNAVKSYLFPFRYNETTTYILEFTNTKIRFYKNQAQLGAPYEVTTTYTEAECATLDIAQSYDTLYIACPTKRPQKLVRTGDTSWTLSDIEFDEWPYLTQNKTNTTLALSGTSGSVTVTASAATFASTDVGRTIRYVSGPDDSKAELYSAPGASQVLFPIPFFPQTSSTVEVFRIANTGAKTELTYNAGSLGANDFKITSGQVEIAAALSSGQQLLVQEKYTCSGIWGTLKITAYTDSTHVTATIVDLVSGSNASTRWRLGAWSDTTGWPSLVEFFGQRLWWAKTRSNPNGIAYSTIQDFENYSPDTDDMTGQRTASTGGFEILADLVSINSMVAGPDLLLGGDGGLVSTGEEVSFTKEDTINVASIHGVKSNKEMIFVELNRKSLYSIDYNFDSSSYRGKNITALTDHLFESYPAAQIVVQKAPFPILWVLRTDGKLCSATLGDIPKWTQHTIGGTSVEVESIAVIPYNNTEELWMVVKRTINGSTKRYVEVLSQPFFNDSKESCIFADSALTYSGVATSTFTGLNHLEGQTVAVMINGSAHDNKVVTSGSISLDYPATTATVGLSYAKNMTTVPLETGKQNGTAIGSPARISHVILDLYETDGLKVGFDNTDLQEILFRPAGLTGGTMYPLFTGLKTELLRSDMENTYKVYLEQPYSLPGTIRSIAYKVNVSDN